MVERSIGQTDVLDLLGFWMYRRDAGKRSDSARSSNRSTSQLHAGSCHSRASESASTVSAGGNGPQGGIRLRLEVRGVLFRRIWRSCGFHSCAFQIGENPEILTTSRESFLKVEKSAGLCQSRLAKSLRKSDLVRRVGICHQTGGKSVIPGAGRWPRNAGPPYSGSTFILPLICSTAISTTAQPAACFSSTG